MILYYFYKNSYKPNNNNKINGYTKGIGNIRV